jgi:hypothetical protein
MMEESGRRPAGSQSNGGTIAVHGSLFDASVAALCCGRTRSPPRSWLKALRGACADVVCACTAQCRDDRACGRTRWRRVRAGRGVDVAVVPRGRPHAAGGGPLVRPLQFAHWAPAAHVRPLFLVLVLDHRQRALTVIVVHCRLCAHVSKQTLDGTATMWSNLSTINASNTRQLPLSLSLSCSVALARCHAYTNLRTWDVGVGVGTGWTMSSSSTWHAVQRRLD